MSTPVFQVDAFADRPFSGNPAAVCLMGRPASDAWLQSVAAEMNLSETAFVWRREGGFHLRWFTPVCEVGLCGHATLATSHVLWESGWANPERGIQFESLSGPLSATRSGGRIYLDFPSKPVRQIEPDGALLAALGISPVFTGKNEFDFFCEVATPGEVIDCHPDFNRLGQITERGVILTAASDSREFDFISRFFAPAAGIDEDPVTGSAHVGLAPYWAARMGRDELVGYQASERGGLVHTRVAGERVHLGGTAVMVFEGELTIAPDSPTGDTSADS